MSTESCSQLLEDQKRQNEEIQQKQDEISQQLSLTLGPAMDALTCGTACQREKVIAELRQKYLNSQTNILTAPQQLVDSEKEFYVFAEGTAAYNAVRTKELQDKANKLTGLMQNMYLEELFNIGQLIKMYNILVIDSDNTVELYNDYEESIKVLNEDIINEKNDVLTNDRKTHYESQEIVNLQFWKKILFWTYYLLVIVFFLGIFFANSVYSFFKKCMIFIILLLYPFYIGIVTDGIMIIFNKFTNILPTNVYKTL